MTARDLSCDEWMRMPISERVIDHIRSCEDCRALFNALADDLDRRAYELEHRN
jgi:predicted anti-sigma-YlaC factor YlaD